MSVKRTVLSSGLRIVTEEVSSVRSAAIGIWVNVGSRDETPAVAGASHFLEHLLFKGTKTRTALEISSSIESLGGEMNAFTGKEYTCFYARVIDTDLPIAVDVISDLITSSLVTAADVDGERKVVLEEIVHRNIFASRHQYSTPSCCPAAAPGRRHRLALGPARFLPLLFSRARRAGTIHTIFPNRLCRYNQTKYNFPEL